LPNLDLKDNSLEEILNFSMTLLKHGQADMEQLKKLITKETFYWDKLSIEDLKILADKILTSCESR
jgi:glutaredoxin 2